jgi:PIN domain nuclease of toxin-antitoxin system
MDLGVRCQGSGLHAQASREVILLDTHALVWLHLGHRRARPLKQRRARLLASPASVLELQFLVEARRLRLRGSSTVEDLAADPQWLVDEPPAGAWFSQAIAVDWTRDPFDRLIVAHALFRNWRLATADAVILERLPRANVMEL